MVKKVKK
jgi:hypothetical protein